MSRRALTLVEMLASLCIAGVLLAILVPALSGAREAARSVACGVNLRTLGESVAAYRSRSRGELPFASDFVAVRYGWIAPLDALAPYLDAPLPSVDRNGEMSAEAPWRCPSDDVMVNEQGCSYLYAPFQTMAIIGAARTTRIWESPPGSRPVFHDGARFHRLLNQVLMDGSVTRASPPLQE